MKLWGVIMLAFLVGIRAANATDQPAIDFSGVLVADGKTKIALTDKASGTTTWVEPGKDFGGYTLARYDAKADSIVLKKNGQEFPLRLVAAKIPANTAASALAANDTVAANAASAPLTPTGLTGPAATPPASASATQQQTAVGPNTPPPVPASPSTTSGGPTSVNISVAPVTPVAAEPSYVTQEGDTLTKISAATGLSLERLQELNPGVNAAALLDPGKPIRTH